MKALHGVLYKGISFITIDGHRRAEKVDIFSVKIAETMLVLLVSLYNKRAKNSFYAVLLTNF